MAIVRPFSAWCPPPALASAIASVPYDVVDSHEARALVEGSPESFLHVIRPEVDLPVGTDLYSDPVYDMAAANLKRWLSETPYTQGGHPQLLVYRLIRNGMLQVGVVGVCSVDDYDDGLIAIHERTRPNKEDDRTRHVVTMRCQAEPIFLAYRRNDAVASLVRETTEGRPPLYDFVAEDGVQHTVWGVADSDALAAAFEAVPMLYVADGHHRAKSASRARETLAAQNPNHTGEESYNYVMSVVFPDDQLAILPYNRIVTDLGGVTAEDAMARLAEVAPLAPLLPDESREPPQRGTLCVYGAGRWYSMDLAPMGTAVIDSLDVSLLQDQVLGPVFGITDPRTDPRIDFVGGARGTEELQRRADQVGGVAFSLFATSLVELFEVADSGEIMPPKSTWFEPKLRSGLFVHLI